MVTGYARWMSAVMIPSRQIPDLLAGHWTLISQLGSVPKTLAWDNESDARGAMARGPDEGEACGPSPRARGGSLAPIQQRPGLARRASNAMALGTDVA
jgi:hypothetical protein